MDECIFCKIASRSIPGAIIFEDGATVAFLDIHPCATGHTVVVPKAHREHLLALEPGEAGLLFDGVRAVAELLARKLKPDGFTIGINHGSAAGQAVSHLHVHIIPRFVGDGGGSIHTVVQSKQQQSLEEVKKLIFS